MGDRKLLPLPSSNYELVIIWCTNHPGNLGAICRTMLNYGFANLRLVNPDCGQMTLKQGIEQNMQVASLMM